MLDADCCRLYSGCAASIVKKVSVLAGNRGGGRDKDGFVGDNANKKTFQQKLDDWRKRIRKAGDDQIGKTATAK
ncbi:hypothetical protein ACC708_36970, partial [Rhizobium ruizarguesonis]